MGNDMVADVQRLRLARPDGGGVGMSIREEGVTMLSESSYEGIGPCIDSDRAIKSASLFNCASTTGPLLFVAWSRAIASEVQSK